MIVAGSTGLVGQVLVRQLAAERTWREVRALVRHALPPDLSVPNVVSVQVDYDRLDPPPDWAAADHVFCALGTTMRQAGSPEAFRRVDFRVPGGASSGSDPRTIRRAIESWMSFCMGNPFEH